MRRWLPYPQASLILVAIWLLLNQSVSPGQILLGLLCGLLGPLILLQLDVPPFRMRRPLAVLRLMRVYLPDMVRSNFKVAKVVLFKDPTRTPGFVRIVLRMRSPYGLAALACLLTATPGTAWVTHNPDDDSLVIHVLDLHDDDDWGEIIKTRYEGLLMEIFE